MLPSPFRPFCLALLSVFSVVSVVNSADWIHWRGPNQNGHSLETGLPDSFDPAQKEKGNVVWTAPFGGRSAPLVMDGRIYVQQGFGEALAEAERVVCLEE